MPPIPIASLNKFNSLNKLNNTTIFNQKVLRFN